MVHVDCNLESIDELNPLTVGFCGFSDTVQHWSCSSDLLRTRSSYSRMCDEISQASILSMCGATYVGCLTKASQGLRK